jgi:PAS domain S-box-containing protein
LSMPNQGLLAITFFEAISFSILLVLFFLLDRGRPARFFRFWIAGWVAQTLWAGILIVSLLEKGNASRLIAIEVQFSGAALFLAAIWEYTGRRVRSYLLSPLLVLGAAVLALVEWHPVPNAFSGARWFTAILLSTLFVTAGWLLWRFSGPRPGYGGRLLSGTLLLAGLHSADMVTWGAQAIFLLRVAFQDFFNVAVGIAMAIFVFEATRVRMEDLNDKLRRLTLITAASTQSFNVDQMLGVVLHHLVESLNTSHGLVRLISGSGENAELVIRSAVGYSDAYLMEHEKISAREPWARRALEQERAYVTLDPEHDLDNRARLQRENLSSAVLVRLPGPDAALGWILVGSTSKRVFHPEEITFLINVANLLGLTVQSVRLFEQVATVQRQWANTFDSIDDPILVHDLEGKIIRVNQAFEIRAAGAPRPLVGLPVAEALRRGARRWIRCPYCEGTSGKSDEIDPSLGGFLLASNSQFHDSDEKPLGIVHVLQDVTERRRAEEQYRTLIENVQEGVFIATPDSRFIHFNEAFMRMLGYEDREELMQVKNVGENLYVNPADRDRLMKLLQDHGSVTNFEFQARRKDGEIRTVLESSFVTRDPSGTVSAYQGFVLDITERKQAEQEIRRRNRELLVLNAIGQTLNQPLEMREMLDRALHQVVELFGEDQGAIYLLEPDTNVLLRAAAFGMRSEYTHYFPPTPFPSDLLEHVRAVRATILSEPGLPLPRVFRDVQLVEGIVASQVVVLWSSSRPIGLLSLGHRSPKEFAGAELNLLTTVGNQIAVAVEKLELYEETRAAYENLRRTQEQLLQSEKMSALGQLISGVAHELNNPLTAILGYGQLLTSTDMVSAEGADYVKKLYKQAQRTHRIVHNLLSFARQHKPERVPVNLNQIIEDTLALREYDLRINNIKVHREFSKELPQTLADPHQLQQVFLNILNNAVDALIEMPAGRELWARTDLEGDRLLVAFIDSGKGVSELPKVFDPFYTTKQVGKGTGLGLSICYGIVTEHGGEILVRNVPPRGACFTIFLPLSPVGSDKKQTSVAQERPAGEGRILLVDEEEAVLELEREVLAKIFGTIHAVRNGREALLVLGRESLDLVVADLKTTGDFTGRNLYDWIFQNRPELSSHLIFTTSGTNIEEANFLKVQHGCPFLQKPFSVEEFLAVVHQTLGSNRMSTLRR